MVYSYLTTPRMYAPRWYHEGMAVFMETWMAGGYGRALGGYDEMVFRTMVHDDAYFYDTVGLESEGKAIDFQVGQVSYLYGTRFITYLADHYGPESLIKWLDRGPDSKASYRAQFKQVYGADLDDEWKRWIEWEREWQRANLEAIREYPVTGFRDRCRRGRWARCRGRTSIRERRELITAVNYPGEFARIVTIDVETWEMKTIAEVATPALYYVTSLAYDPESRTVFFTTDNSRQWRDINAVDLGDRQEPGAGNKYPHRRSGVQPERPLAVGRAAPQRAVDAGPVGASLPRLGRPLPGPHPDLRQGHLRHRHLARRRAG